MMRVCHKDEGKLEVAPTPQSWNTSNTKINKASVNINH